MRSLSTTALMMAASALSGPAFAQPAAAPVPVPVTALIREVTIPHTSFRLANGLTVIVHEDHKAPVVAVTTWYNVGSKDEPAHKTGFAHLFEHLMFNGSEDLPGDYFTYLQQIGATDYNGTTYYDRTNYYETVPTGAFERALFMESDRMGHLLGAVTQGVLDNQRSVVQNEKRQNDSHPGGLGQYALFENLFPAGHPYHHTVIGSMADLDAASLADVKQWFRDKYGPNNAVLAIAGDVTAAQARPLVERYFGPIARGPVNHPATAPVPTLAAPKTIELKDHVATTRITRYWAVPGLLDPRLAALDVGGSILGGLASSRLDQALVRDEKVAVGASAGLIPLQRAGIFTVSATVKPGVDLALVSRRLDAVVADFIARGPSADEVQRAVMSEVSDQVRGLEQVGGGDGKASTLAEGQTYAGNSNFYKQALASYASVTPAKVRTAMQQWLRRPALTITLSPGEREAYAESKPVTVKPAPKDDGSLAKPVRPLPPVGQLTALSFPPITHTTLSNGIRVDYAQRGAVPITQVALAFDAGNAADAPNQRGLAALTMRVLGEATTSMNPQALAEAKERLGTDISTGNSADRSIVYLSALSPNLPASLDLLGDVVRNPAFAAGDIERVRVQSLTGISQLQKDPTRVAQRLLPSVLYGANHPYGGPAGGDPKAIERISRADLLGFQQRWLRPDNVNLFVVSDRPLAQIKPLLDARFGAWTPPSVPRGSKTFPLPPARAHAQKILLIDSPGSPQSTIVGAQLLPLDPRADIVPIDTANDVLGGDFLSRLNMDLREEKGWSYGVSGNQNVSPNGVSYTVSAPVQSDRTGESLAELNSQLTAFLTTKGLTDEELQRTVAKNVNQLPGEFETSQAVLGAMMDDALLGRPDNYYETLAARYRAQTRASADSAIRAAIDPNGFIWIVVGDAKTVRPQLEKLGLPIETVTAP